MTRTRLLWCPKQVSSWSGGAGCAAPATSRRNHHHRCCGIGRLMRRLRGQSKVVRSGRRTAASGCQYDPLSYERNFDSTGFGFDFGDDPTQFGYTFSSRFVALAHPRPQQPPAAIH